MCKICSKPHNRILCSKKSNEIKSETQTEREISTISSNNAILPLNQVVLLPTAHVYVKNISGELQKI